ncbi:hypothetical protein predicted by Glimmer/Critica [Lactococcus cremoris subsp. cremoris MG1363]|uniref:Uncharacterized protein n=1 Tax=Lactococcus lactis subsp. cremoris (strain MG1363) TaxID=416870 RepID=A2RM68_LACLM|nr:hypothetical protein predicted by Glimmer/Critica [Lactococcus cremoris subsp. cremoris MG1363]
MSFKSANKRIISQLMILSFVSNFYLIFQKRT